MRKRKSADNHDTSPIFFMPEFSRFKVLDCFFYIYEILRVCNRNNGLCKAQTCFTTIILHIINYYCDHSGFLNTARMFVKMGLKYEFKAILLTTADGSQGRTVEVWV